MIENILIGGVLLLLVLALIGKLFGEKLTRLEAKLRADPAAPAPRQPAPQAPKPPLEFTRPPPEGDRIRFGYTDREGRESIRMVTPTQLNFGYTPAGERVIENFSAYCHDSRASRTFRVDRMKQAYVFDTGEVLGDAAAIERWLLEELPTPAGRRRRKPRAKPKPRNVAE
ncbi:hypothetical protein ACFFMP_08555 [Pseudoroseomonas cervicalis]|uniref:Uncharacterized protein n=1 Tax=Pseudoroseomonas cervicalis ATCC 49957 TaxID=525371 RepID=D5RTH4_9PROT|nr:hypothetical protein [Pseudoroseomonas cervicalis]EFH09405.1 hypothetical protein HMPREF0731_4386 [Pseudoroseomonas cervicalis ATCC 49957]